MRNSLIACIMILFICSVAFGAQKHSTMANGNAAVTAQATEVEKLDRSEWLWRNTFDNNRGAVSSIYLSNADPVGGKAVMLADDFQVPAGESWRIDSIRTFMFWAKLEPDHYRVIIFPDIFGCPDETSRLKDFTFTASCPNELTNYAIMANVTSENIVLEEGTYWLCIMGGYTDATFQEDECVTYWTYLDTLLSPNQAQCMDSVGIAYPDQYPTNWLGIWFDGENENISTKFWLRGTRTTPIKTTNQQVPGVSVVTFPNPASEHITFQVKSPVTARHVELYNAEGKLVKSLPVKSNRIKFSLNSLTNGVYLYQLLDQSKQSIGRGRFSVSK